MSPMPDSLGFSVYLSSFDRARRALERGAGSAAAVFLSLHISEEFSPDYCARAEAACRWLAQAGYRVVADVSVKTLSQFGESNLVRLAGRLGLWALRVDYGFSETEIAALAREMPVVLNASTINAAAAARIAEAGGLVMAMHNFYPRPETGLDDAFLLESTRSLQAAGIKVLAFIPGDEDLRGPLREGLPTLERHRGLPVSACFADLAVRFGVDGVFAGDPGVSEGEQAHIRRFCTDGVLEIPAELDAERGELYGRVFTCRADSPSRLIRFAESREYSCFGSRVPPGGMRAPGPGQHHAGQRQLRPLLRRASARPFRPPGGWARQRHRPGEGALSPPGGLCPQRQPVHAGSQLTPSHSLRTGREIPHGTSRPVRVSCALRNTVLS